jgi:ATPase family AAA domain-containing protein 2
MTFEAAKKHQPSIIFFDEIDGLAPVRSARQDQIHSSIVSTLLGLMDGLDARGQIVVIGATNRVDSVDPALRRPGRFDRELIFTLPNGVARRKILEIHTTHWKPRPPESAVLDAVASKTVGYCGADLRALCSESALRALRRRYPQIYRSNDKLLIDVEQVRVRTRDFAAAMKEIVPASHRSARTHARPIPGRLAPVLESPFGECVAKVKRIFPQGLTPEVAAVAKGVRRKDDVADDESDDSDSCWSSDAERAGDMDVDISRAGKQRVVHGRGGMDRPVLRPRLLVCGRDGLGQGQIGPALLHHLEGCPVHAIDLPSLLADGGSRSSEEALVTAVREACRAVPSVLYLPHLDVWWSAAHQVLRMTLSIVLRDIPAELPLLVLATAGSTMNELPDEVKDMFADFVEIGVPSGERRLALFAPLRRRAEECPTVTDAVVRRRRAKRRAVVLPKAPPPVAKPPTALDLERREADDEKCIRELRMEMRTFVERLRTDRRFADFRDPVDPTVVTDYLDVIKDPMWIGKISEQVDRGMYPTVLAMVKDFDQLVANVIAYNPPFEEQGAHLCRRAHALVDIVHSWVDNLDPDLVSRCNAIVIARLRRVRLESSGKEAVEAVDAAAEATLPETSLPRSAPAVAVAAAASPPTADAMVVDAASVAAPLPPPRVPGSTDAAGNGPSPVTVVEGKAASGVLKGAAQADHAVVPEGHEVRDKQSVSEDVAVPASVRDVEALVTSWLTITTGMNVDALDTLHARLSCVLHDARRSRDRRSVVESLAAVLVEAGDDPTLRLVQ